jgi:hypothetical protein
LESGGATHANGIDGQVEAARSLFFFSTSIYRHLGTSRDEKRNCTDPIFDWDQRFVDKRMDGDEDLTCVTTKGRSLGKEKIGSQKKLRQFYPEMASSKH